MNAHATQQLLKEADFIERYTRYYRRQLTAAMHRQRDAAAQACVRMCLEALDMISDSKQTMVAALSQMKN